jgi:hypothetical protein
VVDILIGGGVMVRCERAGHGVGIVIIVEVSSQGVREDMGWG